MTEPLASLPSTLPALGIDMNFRDHMYTVSYDKRERVWLARSAPDAPVFRFEQALVTSRTRPAEGVPVKFRAVHGLVPPEGEDAKDIGRHALGDLRHGPARAWHLWRLMPDGVVERGFW